MTNIFNYECLPSKIFLLIAFIGIISRLFQKFSLGKLLLHIISSLLWFWLLLWLCNNKLETVSWVLVITPIVIGLLIFLLFGLLFSKIRRK